VSHVTNHCISHRFEGPDSHRSARHPGIGGALCLYPLGAAATGLGLYILVQAGDATGCHDYSSLVGALFG
jgi:hypothetical protein